MLKPTYKTLPYFYPKVGDLITDRQLEEMKPDWEVKRVGSTIGVDFADSDGYRSDWMHSDKFGYHRFKAVRTFGKEPMWLLTAK